MASENLTKPVCYYDVLQVTQRSSDEDIKRAYRRLAMIYHPDLNPHNRSVAELRFRLINEAYAHLKTKEKRAVYHHLQKARILAAQNDNRAGRTSWFEQLTSLFRTGEKHQA